MISNKALDNAFAEIEANGHFARRNWECCNSCGLYAVPEEYKDSYIFIHSQAEHDLDYYGKCFANWDGDVEMMVAVLEKHGIETGGVPCDDMKIRIYAEDDGSGYSEEDEDEDETED